MDGYRSCHWLLVLTGLLALSGASCPQYLTQYTTPGPRVLPPAPSIEQVIQAVNQNNSQIHSFTTNHAMLSGAGWPTLRASIAFERPWRLRVLADTGLTGRELDLGSNDQIFWFWLRRNQPPALFYCGHDRFATCPARRMIPIEPDFLIEALGTAELDPGLAYQGPTPLPGDRLEIRAIRNTPSGAVTKITIIDAARAWVLEQHVYDARGQLQASSIADGHRRDPLTNLVMPTAVRINVPPAQFSLRVDLGNVQINRLAGDPAVLWAMPNYPGYPAVDLCDPNLHWQQPGGPAATAARLGTRVWGGGERTFRE
jgi:hypothetical protein